MADIRIGVDVDTRQAASEIRRGIYQPLEDVDGALKDVEHASDGVADAIQDASRKASRSLKSIDDDGVRPASQAVGDFKDEAIQNFSEVASSFNGDISQMADGVQGLTGGLASALTPGIGIPIAVLGAAAAAFTANWAAASEETEQRISDMYRDMAESGQDFLTEGFIQDAIKDLADDTGKWSEALQTAKDLGLSIQTVLRASVGDQDAINSVIDATNKKRQTELENLGELDTSTQDYADKVDAVNLKADTTIEKWQQISAETDTAASKAAAVRSAFEGGNAVIDAGVRKLQDMRAELDKLGTGKSIRVDVIPNMDAFEQAIGLQQGRTINVNVNGQITRIGNQVW